MAPEHVAWYAVGVALAYGAGWVHERAASIVLDWRSRRRCEELQQVFNDLGNHRHSARCNLGKGHTGPHRTKIGTEEHWWVTGRLKPGSRRKSHGFTVIEGGDDGAA